jgi:hypothetical protein
LVAQFFTCVADVGVDTDTLVTDTVRLHKAKPSRIPKEISAYGKWRLMVYSNRVKNTNIFRILITKIVGEVIYRWTKKKLLERITINPKIFSGKPIIRGVALPWNISSACRLLEILLIRFLKGIPG